jgi:hypothetical protein
METQYISLNMTPTGVNPCFHISQYDVGRMLGFIVHSGGTTIDLDTYTCIIEATRSDGTAITSAVATTDNIGTFEVTPTMSNKADKYRCQLVIVDENSKRIASLPFDMEVTKAAMDENSESIEEDASLYQQYTEAVQGAIAEANADIQAEENARIAAVNTEATTRANADATLQNNIDAEATARANAITAEATARQTSDNTLQGNISSEASTRASADSNLQAQINQIISPSGEAPSAAEVQNARIGADGVTYDTLGNAIRGQVSDLKSALCYVEESIAPIAEDRNLTFDVLGYVKNDGTIVNVSHSQRTRMIPIKGYKSVKFVGNAYSTIYAIAFFDKTGTILQSGNVVGNGSGTYNANVPQTAFYVVVSNNGNNEKTATIYANDNSIQKEIQNLDGKIDDCNDRIDDTDTVINGTIINATPSFTVDGYYSSSDGSLNPTSNAKNTGLIFVGNLKKVQIKTSLNSAGLVIAFFDENKDPMLSSSVAGNGEGTYTANIPSGAYYVALSAYQYPSATGKIYSDNSLETRVDILEAEQKHYNTFTVISDSYSSFAGYMADPSALCWYPASQSGHSDNNVETVDQTWWYKFAQSYGCQLVENASWSGSCVSYDAYGEGTDDGKDFSFVQRCRKLKSAELIIIYGGTNDAWASVSMGNYKYSGFTESDFETFRPSAAFVIDYIQKHNIGSKILFVYNPTDIIGVNVPDSIVTICEHYGVDCLALPATLANNLTNSHPNENGMTIIANAIKNKLLGQ